MVKMNFTSIAISMGAERDLVEGCIREILQALSRVIASREPIQFFFYNIGYLMVRDFRARVKFTPTFIKRMDGTGQLSKMIERKKKKESKNFINSTNTQQGNSKADHSPIRNSQNFNELPSMNTRNLISTSPRMNQSLDAGQVLPPIVQPQNDHEPSKAGIFSLEDIKNQHMQRVANLPQTPPKDSHAPVPKIHQRETSAVSNVSSNASNNSTENRLKQFLAQSNTNIDVLNNLSYVAYQRKLMNEEKKQREAHADYVLQRFQDAKDRAVMKKEQTDAENARERERKVAAFNLETSLTNTKLEENVRDLKLGEQAKAYIFQRRPLTPQRFEKQQNYLGRFLSV